VLVSAGTYTGQNNTNLRLTGTGLLGVSIIGADRDSVIMAGGGGGSGQGLFMSISGSAVRLLANMTLRDFSNTVVEGGTHPGALEVVDSTIELSNLLFASNTGLSGGAVSFQVPAGYYNVHLTPSYSTSIRIKPTLSILYHVLNPGLQRHPNAHHLRRKRGTPARRRCLLPVLQCLPNQLLLPGAT
jgi:hypothetical protein